MAVFKTGDLWDELEIVDLVLFTSNASTDRFGCLVMGAGSALEAATRFPELPKLIGTSLRERDLVNKEYLLWLPTEWDLPGARVGCLQSKKEWYKPSKLDLIKRAVAQLGELLAEQYEWRVAIPMPGVGCGGLSRNSVLPILAKLPDRVAVYERARRG